MAEYVKNNAILMCSCGLLPSMLTVTSNPKIKARDGLFATNKDNMGGVNIKSFKLCSISGLCIIDGVTMNWINTVPKVKILEYKPLLSTSKLICPKGGIISVLMSGQI